MKKLYSCGAVVFCREGDEVKYVIIRMKSGHHGFPKGRVEAGETEEETARREIFEEAGLKVDFIDGFKTFDEHPFPAKHATKHVTYFLAEFRDQTLVPQEGEITDIALVPYAEAMCLLEFESARRILTEADRFIKALPKNRPQNIFDDPDFFNGYRELRERTDNMNVLLEQPEIKKLLPDLKGKRVLDLGCGYGENCAEFAAAGAERVVGVDLSEKMLSVARSEIDDEKIEFLQMDMADIDRLDGKFDLIFSSLAFHYVEDFDAFAKKLYGKLDDGGTLLFSQEHPINTAGDGTYILDEEGNAAGFDLRDYSRPGFRRIEWIVDGVEKYHRTLGGILNPLIDSGFVIERIVEPTPTDEALSIRPKLIRQFIRPCFIIIKARK